jgi:Clp amino terminal domain, pathogenicity island component/ClpX C4-type zinc finger
MFERFTDRARRVLVHAQEEARLLDHQYIGTEHLLLGLIHEGHGVAARALESLGITLVAAREKVHETADMARGAASGSPPFTPRSKKVLELSLREALRLQHHYIGTEHLLLGLVQEGEGHGAKVLVLLGADPDRVRETVLGLISQTEGEVAEPPTRPVSQRFVHRGGAPMGQANLCSFCQRDLWEVQHYVSAGVVSICAQCIEDAQRMMSDARVEDHRLFLPPRVFGEEPDPAAREAVIRAITDPPSRDNLEDFDELEPYLGEAGRRHPGVSASTRVSRVRFLSPTLAEVQFEIYLGGQGGFPFTHQVRRDGQRWLRRREDQAELLRRGGVVVPPRESQG